MFGKLRDKLKSWTEKISKKAEEQVEENIQEVKDETIEAIEKKSIPKEKKKIEKEPKLQKERLKKEKAETKVEEIIETPEPKEESKKESKLKPIKEISKEELEEKPEPGKESFFKKVTSKINKIQITEEDFEVYAEELEMLLLENNVALEVAEKIVKDLKERIIGQEFLRKEVEDQIKEIFKDIINEILIQPFDVVEEIKKKEDKPYVILFCGINGTGKTTSIAKIAEQLKKEKISVVLAASDTFRAAAIDQLKIHGERLGVNVIAGNYGSDPASVGFDAIKYAKKNKIDCVLIDTAGRIHTSKNLLKEIEKISRVCKPDIKIFVGESITGNDAVEQVKTFNFEIGIDGIILSKADIDEKGGTALSVGYVTKKPILYLGTGQEYDAIEVFDKQKFIEKLGL
jgi:fused signal recognition particle receptor